ncbi:pilus assembly protein TadG-related protein [Chelativorans sp. AA-79]|uniref:pilus assembly protein TadG-related protein n=1 Tax=Chelativorans sp. AA-79 TaxID=3028735 RepID=UPI0023F79930|nr:pilus assembly protein TadG-related protein [Chelativorans sp. AA-79]WEX11706.1 pilus assembly protein TadG-related protein [Chelativorans sp. AA-79]
MARSGWAGRAARAFSDRSGNVAVMSGILLPVVLLAAILGVDQGSLYFERREAQAVTDLAAITAAANIARAGTAAALTMSDNRQEKVEQVDRAAMASPMAAGADPQLLVETGRYTADPSLAAGQRFVVGATPPNAALVTYRKRGTLRLGAGVFDPPVMMTSAIATARAEGAFSVGSRLVSADTRPSILNPLLGKLLGTNLSLKLMDYDALANTDIEALAFINALATELDLTAGTYDSVLAAEATLGQVLRAVSATTTDGTVRQLVLQLAGGTRAGSLKIPLSHLVDLGSLGNLSIGEQAPGLQAVVGVLDLASAAIGIANQGEQVEVELPLELPNVLSTKLHLAIGEPPQNTPWFAIGETGTIVRTAQTRLYLELTVTLLGIAGVKLPLYLELAFAEAELRDVVCSSTGVSQVAIDARPGVLEAWIGQIDPSLLKRFDRRPAVQQVKLVTVDLPFLPNVAIKASAHLQMAEETARSLSFNRHEIEQRVIKTVHSGNYTGSLFQSLVGELRFDTEPRIPDLLKVALDQILVGLSKSLSALGSAIDPILYNVLAALGVHVGEADIRVTGASCSRSVLVN